MPILLIKDCPNSDSHVYYNLIILATVMICIFCLYRFIYVHEHNSNRYSPYNCYELRHNFGLQLLMTLSIPLDGNRIMETTFSSFTCNSKNPTQHTSRQSPTNLYDTCKSRMIIHNTTQPSLFKCNNKPDQPMLTIMYPIPYDSITWW